MFWVLADLSGKLLQTITLERINKVVYNWIERARFLLETDGYQEC